MKTQNRNIPVGVLANTELGQEIGRSTRRWWWRAVPCLQCHEVVWVARTTLDPQLPLAICAACDRIDPKQMDLFPRVPAS